MEEIDIGCREGGRRYTYMEIGREEIHREGGRRYTYKKIQIQRDACNKPHTRYTKRHRHAEKTDAKRQTERPEDRERREKREEGREKRAERTQ
jgi:hypothetical protein